MVSRLEKKLSRDEMAKQIGFVGPTQLSRYETGKAEPNIKTLSKIAEILNLDLHWLITGKAAPDTKTLAIALKNQAQAHLSALDHQIRQLSADIGSLDINRIFKGKDAEAEKRLSDMQAQLNKLKTDYEILSRILAASYSESSDKKG